MVKFAGMKAIYLLSAALLFASCSRQVSTAEPPIALVSDIIADTERSEHILVRGYNAADESKTIFVIGSSTDCFHLKNQLLSCDRYDNVDGRRIQDGLPDFAGEVISTIVDLAHTPYSRYASDSTSQKALAEVNVRSIIAAMDTLCYVNEYDRSGLALKPLPKIIVMASPYAYQYGKYDSDSLFSALGCRLPVVYPLKSMLAQVYERHGQNAAIGVISSKDNLLSNAYSSFVAFPYDSSAPDPLMAFLDSCLAAGTTRPLDAILIDNPAVDPEAVRQTISRITNPDNQGESLSYGKLISASCSVQDALSASSDECYKILRSSNLFTHKIAYPRLLEFKTVSMDGGSTFVLTKYNPWPLQ